MFRDLVVPDFEYERSLLPTLQDTQSLLDVHEAKHELGSNAGLHVGARQKGVQGLATRRGVAYLEHQGVEEGHE